MTPKEKAKELVNKMHLFSSGDIGNGDLTGANAKQCALIHAKEVLMLFANNKYDSRYEYYEQVIIELKKFTGNGF